MKNNLLFVTITILFIACNPDNFKLKPKACFDYSPTNNLKTSDTIKFSNCSVNSNYCYWKFGDGNYSYEKQPKHVYKNKQSYLVKLFVANRLETDTLNTQESDTVSKPINIVIAVPKACFTYLNSVGLKVSNFNCSENSTNYLWDFGDGTTCVENSPIHDYKSSGSYNVKLIASNEGKSDSISKTIKIDDVVNLNNTLVLPNEDVNLDVDGNGTVDFKIQASMTSGIMLRAGAAIYSFNNYEIFSDSVIQTLLKKTWNSVLQTNDSVTSTTNVIIPKIYIFGDKIQNSNRIEKDYLRFCYLDTDRFYVWNWFNSWNKDEIRYIGFRKLYGNITKIGWIKLKILDYVNVTLYSYKIPIETDSLLIDK